jgi:hypothetical protein
MEGCLFQPSVFLTHERPRQRPRGFVQNSEMQTSETPGLNAIMRNSTMVGATAPDAHSIRSLGRQLRRLEVSLSTRDVTPLKAQPDYALDVECTKTL